MAATVCHCPAWLWYSIGLPGAADAPIDDVALAGYLKSVKGCQFRVPNGIKYVWYGEEVRSVPRRLRFPDTR